MKPRVASLQAYEEIAHVIKQRDAIPSDAELALKHGLSRGYIRQLMHRMRKLGNTCYVSCGPNLSDTVSSASFPSGE
jgi:hypothetical protein